MEDARDELARIDEQGVAHPIGVVASQRMRARAGAYRVLPAPSHVVLMRFTGEDGRRDDEDGAIVRIAGEITAPAAMCDVLAIVAQTGWRGELVVQDGESSRSIYLEAGNVVGARSSVVNERIGMVMYRFGAIDQAQLDAALRKVEEGRRFGEAVVELGLMSGERVYSYISRQAEEIVFATFSLADGTFFFLDGFDPARLVSRHSISANALLMDGVTRLDEMRYFRQKIPSGEHVAVRVEGRPPPAAEFVATWAAVDGKRTVSEIGRVTGRGDFATTKDVYALVQAKNVSIQPPRMCAGPDAVVETANSALRAIHQAADAAEKGDSLRASLASFAVGGGVYDILLRGAGPAPDGGFNPARVAANASVVAVGSDPETFLKASLHEYVSFALFSAGSALGSEKESELAWELDRHLDALSVQG